MPVITLPHPSTTHNAPANAAAIAIMILDALNPPHYVGPYPNGDECCTMCGTAPGLKGRLFKIVVNVVADEYVLIGIDVCRTEHLAAAINDLLATERAGTHLHKAARIRRLEDALAVINR